MKPKVFTVNTQFLERHKDAVCSVCGFALKSGDVYEVRRSYYANEFSHYKSNCHLIQAIQEENLAQSIGSSESRIYQPWDCD